MIDRPTSRALPVLDMVPPGTTSARGPVALADERVEEYRPEAASLPSFAIWTLGCQMNRSDSEEMAGRPARRRLRGGALVRDRRARGDQHLRDP